MLVAICPVAARWRLEMDIKPGDVAIFKNGEEAKVIKINKRNDINRMIIYFDKKVVGFLEEKASVRNYWVYLLNGKFDSILRQGNNIVKVIPC